MKMSKKYIIPAAVFVIAFNASAQDLSTEVVVDRTVETFLPDAKPLKDIFPGLLEAPQADMKLKMADYTLPSSFNPMVPTGIAPAYTGIAAPDTCRGYAWLGYFPTYNLGVAAGYRFVDKKDTRVGASLNFDGYSYKNSLDDITVGNNAFKVNLFAEHWLNNGLKLGAYADYASDWLKIPGALSHSESQRINNMHVRLSASRNTGSLYYFGRFDFRYLGLGEIVNPSHNKANNKHVMLDGGFAKHLSDKFSLGADIEGNVLACYDNMALGAFTPKVIFHGADYELSVGMRLDLALSAPGNRFHVAPHISGVWHASPRIALYGELTGGNRLQTLYNLYCYSPFAAVDAPFRPSYSPADCNIGVRAGAFGGFKFDIFAGWTKANNVLMPATALNPTYTSLFFASTDLSGVHAGIAVAYSYSSVADFGIRFCAGPEGVASTDGQYFDRAKYTMGIKTALHPSKNWTVDLRYDLRGGRRYACYNPDETLYDIGSVSDFGLGATWKAGHRISVFLRLDNIFGKRALLLPGLYMQGFHGLAGVDFRF